MAMIRLSDAIENLRAELARAHKVGKSQDINLNLGGIELELEVVAEDETSGDAKVNWWIFGGGVSGKMKDASTHKLKLNLQAVDKKGRPLRVSRSATSRPD